MTRWVTIRFSERSKFLALLCKKLFYIDQYPAILLLFGLAPSVKQHFLTQFQLMHPAVFLYLFIKSVNNTT
jgi:hypothetical protein